MAGPPVPIAAAHPGGDEGRNISSLPVPQASLARIGLRASVARATVCLRHAGRQRLHRVARAVAPVAEGCPCERSVLGTMARHRTRMVGPVLRVKQGDTGDPGTANLMHGHSERQRRRGLPRRDHRHGRGGSADQGDTLVEHRPKVSNGMPVGWQSGATRPEPCTGCTRMTTTTSGRWRQATTDTEATTPLRPECWLVVVEGTVRHVSTTAERPSPAARRRLLS
jgi:hypothetical protein